MIDHICLFYIYIYIIFILLLSYLRFSSIWCTQNCRRKLPIDVVLGHGRGLQRFSVSLIKRWRNIFASTLCNHGKHTCHPPSLHIFSIQGDHCHMRSEWRWEIYSRIVMFCHMVATCMCTLVCYLHVQYPQL